MFSYSLILPLVQWAVSLIFHSFLKPYTCINKLLRARLFFPKVTDVIDTRCLCKKRWQEVFTLSVVSHCSFHLECGILSHWRPVSDKRFYIFAYIFERWTESVPIVWKASWYSITSADTGTVCMIQVNLSGKALSNHAKLFPFPFPHKIPSLINPLIPQDQQR